MIADLCSATRCAHKLFELITGGNLLMSSLNPVIQCVVSPPTLSNFASQEGDSFE